MIRRTLLSSLLALVLVAAPAAALPSAGLPLSSAGWLTAALDGLLALFTVEKARETVDPNGETDKEFVQPPIDPVGILGPRASTGPGTA